MSNSTSQNYHYPYYLSDDAWAERFITTQQQIALLKLNVLFHEKLVLPCTELMSNPVLFDQIEDMGCTKGIGLLYKEGIISPLIYNVQNLEEVAVKVKNDENGHHVNDRERLFFKRKRILPKQKKYDNYIKHAKYLDAVSNPIRLESNMCKSYQEILRPAVEKIYKKGFIKPGNSNYHIPKHDNSIKGLRTIIEEDFSQTDVVNYAISKSSKEFQQEIIALSLAARCRAFKNGSNLNCFFGIPTEMVPFWNLLAQNTTTSIGGEYTRILLRLTNVLKIPYDEILGIRNETPMSTARENLNLYLDGKQVTFEVAINSINTALEKIEIGKKKKPLGEALKYTNRIRTSKSAAAKFINNNVPKYIDKKLGIDIATQIPICKNFLPLYNTIEANDIVFVYCPFQGTLSV